MLTNANAIGEVIESSTTHFVAQCLEVPRQHEPRLYDPPVFGSYVKVVRNIKASQDTQNNNTGETPSAGGLFEEVDPFADPPVQNIILPEAVYALVFSACTTSLEPNRRPSALGIPDEEEIRKKQPQIFELLRTEFSALSIAYSCGDDKGLRRHIPPIPPRIHAMVLPCDEMEVGLLTEDLSFLRSILLSGVAATSGVPSDELAAACLREARSIAPDDTQFLYKAGKALASILTGDYERLQSILRKVV